MTEQLLLFDLEDTYNFDKADGEGKECSICNKYKPVTSFTFAGIAHNFRESRCTACRTELKRVSKRIRAEQTYPPDDYSCPICSRRSEALTRFGRRNQKTWAADHCHATHKFRGWICYPCNTGIGMFEDDPVRIKKAVSYLEK